MVYANSSVKSLGDEMPSVPVLEAEIAFGFGLSRAQASADNFRSKIESSGLCCLSSASRRRCFQTNWSLLCLRMRLSALPRIKNDFHLSVIGVLAQPFGNSVQWIAHML